MGHMTDERVSLRNKSGRTVELGPTARPVPAIVPADGIVEVDAWAADVMRADGGWKVATKADRAAAEDAAAARLAEVAAVEVPPAADTPTDDADGDDATAEEN